MFYVIRCGDSPSHDGDGFQNSKSRISKFIFGVKKCREMFNDKLKTATEPLKKSYEITRMA